MLALTLCVQELPWNKTGSSSGQIEAKGRHLNHRLAVEYDFDLNDVSVTCPGTLVGD